MINSKNNYKRKRSLKGETEKRSSKKRKLDKHKKSGFLADSGKTVKSDEQIHDNSNKKDNCSVDLPPEIWKIIIDYFDADTIYKYSMLSKETLKYAFKISELKYKDLFYSNFPRICVGYDPKKSIHDSCRIVYYLPRIVSKKKGTGYICHGANINSVICKSCFNKTPGRIVLGCFIGINNIDKFRRRVKRWLKKSRLYRRCDSNRPVPLFLLEYVNEHRIFDVYKYTSIIKNYDNIRKKEIM